MFPDVIFTKDFFHSTISVVSSGININVVLVFVFISSNRFSVALLSGVPFRFFWLGAIASAVKGRLGPSLPFLILVLMVESRVRKFEQV